MAYIKIYRKYFIAAAVLWAVCLVLFVLVYILVLRPQSDNDRRLENRLTEVKLLHDSALKAAQKGTRIRMNEQISRLRDRLWDFVIDLEDSANLTFDISQIATERQISSFSVRSRDSREVSPIPDCSHIYENHIHIDFGAGFNEFAKFLNALERHRPVLFVDTFKITRSEQDDQAYQVSLDVVCLVRKQPDNDTADGSSAHARDVEI